MLSIVIDIEHMVRRKIVNDPSKEVAVILLADGLEKLNDNILRMMSKIGLYS